METPKLVRSKIANAELTVGDLIPHPLFGVPTAVLSIRRVGDLVYIGYAMESHGRPRVNLVCRLKTGKSTVFVRPDA